MFELFVPDAIWTVTEPFSFLGIPVGARMTVVRLASGELWVHSPVGTDHALRRELDALGPVRHVVVPSRFHYLCAAEFHGHYPDARVYVSPAAAPKLGKLRIAGVLGDEPEPAWAGELEQLGIRGHRFMDEVLFFHPAARTLIVTDLLLSTHADSPWIARLAGRLGGFYERPAPPPELRFTFKDPVAWRECLERVLAWDFERIVVSHGHVISTGGKQVLRRAFRSLLRPS